jgi:hypothetical protein
LKTPEIYVAGKEKGDILKKCIFNRKRSLSVSKNISCELQEREIHIVSEWAIKNLGVTTYP